MSSDTANSFNKDNLDTYLKELAKLFRKQNGRGATAEVVEFQREHPHTVKESNVDRILHMLMPNKIEDDVDSSENS
jgi:hypothetical protein